jgi:two-component system OmpR family response regulator
MRILLIEDDAPLADGLQRALRHAGHAVDWAPRGSTAESLLGAQDYDIAILDLGLPDIDGGALLARLRERKFRTPVLVLSAREATDERVRLLDLGADDYLVKPVAISELEARIRAITRRAMGAPEVLLQIGRLNLDLGGRRAWCDDTSFELTAREWAALEYLAVRANRVVSKEQIMQALYDWDSEITPNAVEKFISRLRAKLEPSGLEIRTVRGLGYYLVRHDGAPAA